MGSDWSLSLKVLSAIFFLFLLTGNISAEQSANQQRNNLLGELPTTKKEASAEEKSSEEELIHIYWMRVENHNRWTWERSYLKGAKVIKVKLRINKDGQYFFPKLKLYFFGKHKKLICMLDHTYLDNETLGEIDDFPAEEDKHSFLKIEGMSSKYPHSTLLYLRPIKLSTIEYQGKEKHTIVFVIPYDLGTSYLNLNFKNAIFIIGNDERIYARSLRKGLNPLDFNFPERPLLLREEGKYAPQSSKQANR